MFGIGGQELILLMIIGLVVLGPERLPRIANQIGGWLGQARRMTRVMKRQLEEELDLNKSPTIKPPPPSAREPSRQPPQESLPERRVAPAGPDSGNLSAANQQQGSANPPSPIFGMVIDDELVFRIDDSGAWRHKQQLIASLATVP